MRLDAIRDQPRALALLGRALERDRVAHAYAFVGSPGSGRTATALAFAEALLCEQPSPGGACGACRACARSASRQHPDLHVVEPTPPEKNPRGPLAIRIEAVRELERQASLRAAMGRRKVFVLDDADRMTGETPQAFLKTLEEPPDRTVMILVLARLRSVPATVLSRCQIVRFAPRPDERIGPDRAEVVALLEEVHAKGMDGLFRRTQAADRGRAERLVDACWHLVRDLLLVEAGAPPALLGDAAQAEALRGVTGAWTVEELERLLAWCREARRGLTVNVTPRLSLDVLLSRLARRAA